VLCTEFVTAAVSPEQFVVAGRCDVSQVFQAAWAAICVAFVSLR